MHRGWLPAVRCVAGGNTLAVEIGFGDHDKPHNGSRASDLTTDSARRRNPRPAGRWLDAQLPWQNAPGFLVGKNQVTRPPPPNSPAAERHRPREPPARPSAPSADVETGGRHPAIKTSRTYRHSSRSPGTIVVSRAAASARFTDLTLGQSHFIGRLQHGIELCFRTLETLSRWCGSGDRADARKTAIFSGWGVTMKRISALACDDADTDAQRHSHGALDDPFIDADGRWKIFRNTDRRNLRRLRALRSGILQITFRDAEFRGEERRRNPELCAWVCIQ